MVWEWLSLLSLYLTVIENKIIGSLFIFLLKNPTDYKSTWCCLRVRGTIYFSSELRNGSSYALKSDLWREKIMYSNCLPTLIDRSTSWFDNKKSPNSSLFHRLYFGHIKTFLHQFEIWNPRSRLLDKYICLIKCCIIWKWLHKHLA